MPVSALASVSDGRLPPAIIAPDGAAMKFFADFTPFSARYCDIAVRARRRSYGRRAINSKQYLAENRLFRQSDGSAFWRNRPFFHRLDAENIRVIDIFVFSLSVHR